MSDENNGKARLERGLSAAYRDLADETAPARLDARILAEAARTTGKPRRRPWRDAWFRPLAFAATFGLSLALILQFSDSGLLGPTPQEPAANGILVAPDENPMRDAAAVTAERIRRLEAEATAPSPGTAVPATPMSPTASPGEPNTRLDGDDRCSESQRADTGSWWRCIEDLEQRGLSGAAEAELQALLAAHPGFSAPE